MEHLKSANQPNDFLLTSFAGLRVDNNGVKNCINREGTTGLRR